MEINYKIVPCFFKVNLTECPCYRDQRYQSYQLYNKSLTTEYAVSLFIHSWLSNVEYASSCHILKFHS